MQERGRTKNCIAFLLVLLMSVAGCSGEDASALADAFLPPPVETGSGIIYSTEYMGAARILQNATAQKDENRQRQLLRKAIRGFTADLQQRSSDVSVTYNNRGVAYARLGEYELAIADYTAALEISPTSADFVKNRGLAYEQWGDLDKALADFRTFLAQIADAPGERQSEERTYFSRKIAELSSQTENAEESDDNVATVLEKGDVMP